MEKIKKIKYRHSKWFNKLLRLTFGKYLSLRFNVKINNEEIADVKPPYIVIGNHIGAWDPFLMSMGISEPIYFVISDTHFRHFWLRQLLKLVGGIPKSKKLADSGTIRAIISIIKNKGVVGVYPEGARNWDLKNVPVFYSTAKLIKSLKVPVINTLMEGAGLTRPRWARSSRTGVIHINYSVLFTPDDINKMSTDEIYRKIVEGIRMNEYEWQEKNMVPFKGRNLAEYLDLFLVVCPRCKSLCSLRSRGDFFTCGNCNYTVRYNEYGYFDTEHEPFFLSPQTWSDWQNTYLYELFSKNEYMSGQIPLFSDTGVKIFTGKRRGRLRQYKKLGKVELFFDRLILSSEKTVYAFPISEMTGVNIQNNNKFEFYYHNTLYRFKFTTQHKSVYKYELAIRIINSINSQNQS